MPYKEKSKHNEHARQYALLHKAEIARNNHKYVETHKEKIANYRKLYYESHRDELLQKYRLRASLRSKEEREKYYKAHYAKHRLEMVEYRYKRAIALKIEVLAHYGNGNCACTICGYDTLAALSIDHIDGNGSEHRRTLGNNQSGNHFYLWLKRKGFPEGYQTLCMNCQWVKRANNKEHSKRKELELVS